VYPAATILQSAVGFERVNSSKCLGQGYTGNCITTAVIPAVASDCFFKVKFVLFYYERFSLIKKYLRHYYFIKLDRPYCESEQLPDPSGGYLRTLSSGSLNPIVTSWIRRDEFIHVRVHVMVILMSTVHNTGIN